MVNNTGPRIDHDTRVYWAGLGEGRLLIARCQACRTWIHPPKGCCPSCWSNEIDHEEPSGAATLFSYLAPRSRGKGIPAIIGWVELVEQDRLLIVAPVVLDSETPPRPGEPLELFWSEKDGAKAPMFKRRCET